jgi:hypothetical protein
VTRRRALRLPVRSAIVAFAIAGCAISTDASPATAAFNPVKPVCGVAGWISGIAGKACGVLQHGGKLVKAGKKLLTGHPGAAASTLLGSSGGGSRASTVVGLAAIGAWVLLGAKAALHETGKVIGQTTSPQLGTTWFSSTYWRMTSLAAILTLPFLFAAAVQALMRSDLALLARAALGYLPLAMLAVSVAAPLTMLLLAASDQMSAIVSSAGRGGGVRFLQQVGFTFGTVSVLDGSPFLAFLVGLFTTAGALVLWFELLMRQAAVYVVVLMLPLAFSALVWPARRMWAIRAVELLVALILSKFAIVAVLSLAGAALGQRGAGGVGGMLTGMVLVALGAFAPWALLRLLPLAELASGAAGHLRGEGLNVRAFGAAAGSAAEGATEWAGSVTAGMRREASESPAPENGASTEVAKLPPGPGAGGGADSEGEADDEVPSTVPAGAGVTEAAINDGVPSNNGSWVASGGSVATASSLASGDAPATDAPSPTSGGQPPGVSEMWEGGDHDGSEFVLGPEGFTPKLWARRRATGEYIGASPGHGEPGEPDRGADGTATASTADDHDPLPPEQEPEEGRL